MSMGTRIVVIVVFLLTIGVLTLAFIVFWKKSPVTMKIGEWQSGVNRHEFTCPKGTAFHLALGIPEEAAYDAHEISGSINVTEEGISILQSRITSNDVMRVYWLPEQCLKGILLTGYTNALSKAFCSLKPGRKVRIEVLLTPMPPPKSSLWLCYLARLGSMHERASGRVHARGRSDGDITFGGVFGVKPKDKR